MNIQITARHFNASPQLHANLREDIDKLSKFNDSITGVHVILDAQQVNVKKAEMVVNILDKTVCAHAEEDNMFKAIEGMLSKVERQLKKENEKLKVRRSVPISEVVADTVADTITE